MSLFLEPHHTSLKLYYDHTTKDAKKKWQISLQKNFLEIVIYEC